MWTFLQLAQRMRQDAGIAGSGPLTVVGQTGELQRLIDYLADAWFDIQAEHGDWRFLRQSVSFTTNVGQVLYTPAQAGVTVGAVNWWVRNSFRVYPTASGIAGEIPLSFLPYEQWRDVYQLGSQRSVYGKPCYVTITPSDALAFGPIPASGYTIVGDYYAAPVRLANDTDVPSLPEKHNPMLIVTKALLSYGAFESAPEVYQHARLQYTTYHNRLLQHELPEMGIAPGGY